MKIRAYHRHYLDQLKEIYPMNEAAAITDRVFESVLQLSKTDIITHPDKEINATEQQQLDKYLNALLEHTPVQYVLGKTWFYGLEFIVNEHVLIPRPETEELVDWILKEAKNSSKVHPLNILDIGTGSGCIGVSLKKNLPGATMMAIDKSEGAINIASANAGNQGVIIQFRQTDFLDEFNWEELGIFDLIISNPPYIPLQEKEKLDKNVTEHEPAMALFVPDDDPQLFYRKIVAFGLTHLNKGGKIFVEMHEDYAHDTRLLFEQHYNTVIPRKDLFGKDRMLCAFNS